MAITLNASTSTGLVQTADTSGQIDLQSNGTTKLSVLSTGVSGVVTSATSQASTSGTAINFTSIPSWAKRITVMFAGVSTSGTSNIQIQLGTGGTPTYTTSGYVGGVSLVGSSTFISTGIGVTQTTAAATTFSGLTTIANITGNTWTAGGYVSGNATNGCTVAGSSIALGAALTAVRVTTVNGTDTFDAGSINILYEG
jgi:hypothetical protein